MRTTLSKTMDDGPVDVTFRTLGLTRLKSDLTCLTDFVQRGFNVCDITCLTWGSMCLTFNSVIT